MGHDGYRDQNLKLGSLRVRWGAPLGIDSNNAIIRAGDTSSDLWLIKERYGDDLKRHAGLTTSKILATQLPA